MSRIEDLSEPERWRRISDVFHQALEIPASERASWLLNECSGDRALHEEVRSLLGAAEEDSWIDRPHLLFSDAGGDSDTGADAETSPVPVQRTLGHYSLFEKLGEGGMGAVYKATDNRLGRTVAIKVITPSDPTGLHEQRLMREARAASSLNHPNIVTVYEYDACQGVAFIAMEYIQGETLHDILARGGAPLATLLGYAAQTARAVAKAHAAGIVHRDLKPKNIMVTGDGVVKVLDFGIARQSIAGSDDTQTQLTSAGVTMGTPSYMSPEQAVGGSIGPASDVFSFGAILYEMMCGRRPFTGGDTPSVLYRIIHENPAPPSTVNAALAPSLSALIQTCLEKDPAARPASLDEVARQIVSPAALPAAPPAASPGPALAAFTVLAIALAAGGYYAYSHRAPAPPLAPASRPAPAETLAYRIEAQNMLRGKPAGDPRSAAPEEVFPSGSRFRLVFDSPTGGWLYLFEESSAGDSQTPLQLLFPLPSANGGSAHIAPGAHATGWFVFEGKPATEAVWALWARGPVQPIEDVVSRVMYPPAWGLVRNPAEIAAVRASLAGAAVADARSEGGQIWLSGQASNSSHALAARIALRHE